MNAKALELAARRGALVERIANQRALLAQQAAGVERLCAGGDALRHGLDWLKQHPVAVGAAACALVLTRPRRAWRWAKRGLFLWRGWRSMRSWLPAGRP
ncbi:MAG: YqjK-like family protein [Azonexus sp.]|jgi:hypothetical protein|nr:YqjK-like family protein [Azonexus sp.]